ncbi:hypothetical protein BC834DRAFT_1000863, partial [Gloeopeniophorella convolvens]
QRHLPVEIVEHIVNGVLCNVHAFSSIAALSLASRQFRHITLRAYFHRISLPRLVRATRIAGIPQCFLWIRHLSTTMQVVEKKALPMHKMQLQSLVLSCETVSMFSLATSVLLVVPHLPDTLTSLKLGSLPHITQSLLERISGRCKDLKELEISVIEQLSADCCWTCFEDSSSYVKHSPVGGPKAVFDTAEDLATLYARCLRPLRSLQRLSIGVLLSPPEALAEHIEHHASIREDRGINAYLPYTPARCVPCWETYGLRTREDELVAAMKLAQVLKSLEVVRWRSWFTAQEASVPSADERSSVNPDVTGEDGREAEWAIFEIQRKERRIKVWRETVAQR